MGEREDHVGGGASEEPEDKDGAAAQPVRESTPEGRHEELEDGVGRHQKADLKASGPQVSCVDRQEGKDDPEPYEVQEHREEQEGQTLPALVKPGCHRLPDSHP